MRHVAHDAGDGAAKKPEDAVLADDHPDQSGAGREVAPHGHDVVLVEVDLLVFVLDLARVVDLDFFSSRLIIFECFPETAPEAPKYVFFNKNVETVE